MKTWEDLSLDINNIGYLSKVNTDIKAPLPDEKDKQKSKEEKDKMEKGIVEKHRKDAESLYSYDESKVNSFGNKISKSISYLELVAKILPNFRHMLTASQKQDIVNILYTYPNKLLYFMLKDIDENYNEIINDILESAPRTKKGLLVTKEMITNELHNQSLAYILAIYDFVAGTSSNSKTILDLNKFNFDNNTNYKIQNILMEENAGRFHELAVKAEKIYKDAQIPLTKNLVMFVVRKYFLCHDIAITGEAQHLIDVFFAKEQKKEIKMIQAKNRIIKK